MPQQMTIRINGVEGQIEASALEKTLEHVLRLLKGATGRPEADLRWVLTDISAGSVNIVLSPSGVDQDVGDRALSDVWTGLKSLHAEPGIPPGWDDTMLSRARDLTLVADFVGVDSVEVVWSDKDQVELDTLLRENVEASLVKHVSLGSVTGRLYRYMHSQQRREIGIEDRVTGEKLAVTFPEHMARRVRDAIESVVVVWGELQRNDRGQKVKLAMLDFEVVEEAPPPRPVREITGVLGQDWTGDSDVVTWVKRQRD